MTDEGLITFCGKRAVEFERYFIQGEYDDRSIEDALKLYGSFHILEALQEKWSDAHMFKCNCPRCFQYAGCHHVVLATMVCDPSLVCPTKYLLSEIQALRARGDGLVQGRETRVMGKVSWRVGRGWMDLQHQWKK